MDSTPAAKNQNPKVVGRDSSGIALFMVLAAVSMLAILVTEFVYIAQINQRIAFDALDQVKAHYLAKSGLKLSLLRLKAYSKVKALVGTGGAAAGVIPKSVVDKVWSFPFFYPIPENLPGLTMTAKDAIKKFTKDSNLDGKFSTLIESESSKYNINSILAAYAPSPSPSASSSGNTTAPVTSPSVSASSSTNPSASPSFDPTQARKALSDYLGQIVQNKSDDDSEFSSEYRDMKWDDFMDGIFAWADRTYVRQNQGIKEIVPFKGAPFYSLSELHMIPMMDDTLYNLLSPSLTAAMTPGINLNSLKEDVLRALVPGITKDEVADFFTFRDSEEADNSFTKTDDFFTWLKNNVAIFRKSDQQIATFKQNLTKAGIRLVTDESLFKITVQASSNQATQTLEAWVTLTADSTSGTPTPKAGATPPAPTPSASTTATNAPPDAGLKINFMRIL